MMTYRMENTLLGLVLGDYEGATLAEALHAMARDAIRNYLGLTLETVSGMFSRLYKTGLVEGHGSDIRIECLEALVVEPGRASRRFASSCLSLRRHPRFVTGGLNVLRRLHG